MIKVRQDKQVISKSIFLALGINTQGHKELMGMWIAENEGAKFWLNVLTELQNRGVQDIFIACVDGLKGFPDAINAVFPQTHIQLCIVHMVRNSLKFVPWKDYKAVTADLKKFTNQKQRMRPYWSFSVLAKCGMTNIRKSVSHGMPIGLT